ncbi:ATP-binding protein [Actinomyces sp. MRS3W]|uniref:ATP-binding protein n=1 Tax=Actinomyces sp. MRS3W TaxID=2800796 RepID=UPI0028FD2326|nr:ATP-binding protein [Actinomyces sp. MRS3W]MDU0348770.1 ATP-binding protein [Actinomyces sp. MRS3W]
MSTRVILLAGPSGSGKTSLLRHVGARRLKLDDFYRDGDEPGMPLLDGTISGSDGVTRAEAMSDIDWDNPASWDADRAMAAILELCAEGSTTVPVYSIPDNATVDYTTLDVDAAPAYVAEGVFAAELIDRCREAGVLADALVLRRPRLQTWWFRLRRDLAEHRKPLHVLLRRGLRLAHEEPGKIAGWVAKGCRLVDRDECEKIIARHIGAGAEQAPRPAVEQAPRSTVEPHRGADDAA